MRGWWVDGDGNPVAYKDENSKPRGTVAFIKKVMPSEDPYLGTSYIWDFVAEQWVQGPNPVKDEIDQSLQKEQQLKDNAVQAFQQLNAALNDPATDFANATVIKAGFTRVMDMFRYVATSLDD